MDFFESVIFSSWSYIMGPQVERLWIPYGNSDQTLSEIPKDFLKDFNLSKRCAGSDSHLFSESMKSDLKAFLMMSGQLLLSEVETSKPFEQNISRFFVCDDKILVAVVFNVDSWPHPSDQRGTRHTCLCLGILFKCQVASFVLDSLQLIDLQLRSAIGTMQKSKGMIDEALKQVPIDLGNLKNLLYTLYSNSLFELPTEVRLQSANSKLVSKSVVSHLQTSCHSVVIGSSQLVIKQVLQILSLFNTESENSCSRYFSCDSDKSIYPGLYLQVILKNGKSQHDSLPDDVVKNSFPLTVIDVDLSKVRQSFPIDSHERNRNSWKNVTDVGTLVPKLLEDLAFFKKEDSTDMIQQFNRFLLLKSVSAIKIIESFRQLGKLLVRSELMSLLGVSAAADLQLLLGCAEKLKPGIRTSML